MLRSMHECNAIDAEVTPCSIDELFLRPSTKVKALMLGRRTGSLPPLQPSNGLAHEKVNIEPLWNGTLILF
jgi:hypothetical protein